jgi:truncated hemoglobin YjbI
MALNFLPLGFSFSIVDKGFKKGLEGMAGLLANVSREFNSVGMVARQFTSEAMNLTTSYESQLQQFDKAARQIAAQHGAAAGDLNKISKEATSAAVELNRGIDETTKAYTGFERAGKEALEGIAENYKELLKLSEVLGVDSFQLGDQVRSLQKSLGYTSGETKEFLQTVVATGQAVGDLSGTMSKVPSVLELMRKEQALGRVNFKQYGKEVLTVTQLFSQMGLQGDVAYAAAQKVSESLTEIRFGFQELLGGKVGVISGLSEGLAKTFGSFDKAMKVAEGGPAAFMKNFVDQIAEFQKTNDLDSIEKATRFADVQLRGILGDEFANFLMKAAKSSTTELEKMQKTLSDVSNTGAVDLKNLTKEAWRSGRSLQEALKLMEDQFETKFRAMGRANSSWLKDTQKAYKEAEGILEDLAKDDGPLGEIVRKVSDFSQRGILAFFPKEWQGVAPVMGKAVTMISEIGEQLSQSGVLAFTFLTPLKLLAGAVTAVTLKFMQNKKALGDVRKAQKQTVEDIRSFVLTIRDRIKGLLQGASFIKDTIGEIFRDIGPIFKDLWEQDLKPALKDLWANVQTFLKGFWGGLTGDPAIQKTMKNETANFGISLGSFFHDGFVEFKKYFNETLWPEVKAFFKGFWGGLTGDSAMQQTMKNETGNFGISFGTFLKDAVTDGFNALLTFLKEKGPGIVKDLFTAVSGAASTFLKENPKEAGILAGIFALKGDTGTAALFAGGAAYGAVSNAVEPWLNIGETVDKAIKAAKGGSGDPGSTGASGAVADYLKQGMTPLSFGASLTPGSPVPFLSAGASNSLAKPDKVHTELRGVREDLKESNELLKQNAANTKATVDILDKPDTGTGQGTTQSQYRTTAGETFTLPQVPL